MKKESEDRLAIHLEDMELQHRRLLELLGKAVSAAAKPDVRKLTEALELFLQYVEVHFSDEEQVMRAWNYPGLKEHADLHAEFQLRFAGRIPAYLADPLVFTQAEADELSDWLTSHADDQDELYLQYVRSAAASA